MSESIAFTGTRHELYDEVWSISVAGLARKYNIPYASLLKQIKALNIAFPPSGYWTQLSNGKPISKIELSGNPYETVMLYRSEINRRKDTLECTTREKIVSNDKSDVDNKRFPEQNVPIMYDTTVLNFLDIETRKKIASVAAQVSLPKSDKKFSEEIIKHNKQVMDWHKELKKNEDRGWGKRNMPEVPLFADTVSEESLPRINRIVDTILCAMRPLGCTLNTLFQFVVNNEIVPFDISESKDEVKHILTKEENMKVLQYEDDVKRHAYAYKPTVRKYDHPYNGRICFTINGNKKFRDCASYRIEDKIGDIIITFFEASEIVRQARIAKEERQRQEADERQKKERRRELYNTEVEKTLALVNSAEDYSTACKIRAYIDAVKVCGKTDEATTAWLEWAASKADWYDPTISREDEYFGKRNHAEDEIKKNPEKKYSSWGW